MNSAVTAVWFMLFFDLVVAAAFGQTTDYYSETPTWAVMCLVLICNLYLYLLWLLTSIELISNPGRNTLQKAFGLLEVLSLSLMSIALGWDSNLTNFWGLLAVGVAVLALVGLILSGRRGSSARGLVPWLLVASGIFLTGAVASALGAVGEGFSVFMFLVAGVTVMLVSSVSVISRRISADSSLRPHELQERFGMLLLIVLGETFIVLVKTLGATDGIPQPLFFVLAISVVFAIWLLYFPRLAQFERPETAGWSGARFAAHFVLVVCSANAVAAFAAQTLLYPSPGETGWGSDDWSSLPLVVLLLAIVWLGYLDASRWTVIQTIHAVSALVILLFAGVGLSDNLDFGGAALAISAVVFLGDALVSDVVSRRREAHSSITLP